MIEQWKREGRQWAEEQLKEVVRAAHAKRTSESKPLGDEILAAVEALPDRRRFDALPQDAKRPLVKFLELMEIKHAADAVFDELDRQFPKS